MGHEYCCTSRDGHLVVQVYSFRFQEEGTRRLPDPRFTRHLLAPLLEVREDEDD